MSAVDTIAARWTSQGVDGLTRPSLDALFADEIPFVRVKAFATTSECDLLVNAAVRLGFGSYRDVEPRIDRIGNTVFEFNSVSRADYFRKNVELRDRQRQIFGVSFDPVHRLIEMLVVLTGRRAWVARNDHGELYYAGLIRRIERGTLVHVDFAPGEQPGWEVSGITHQLAWNLYLRASLDHDGKTHIFNRQWDTDCDVYKDGSYGYEPAVVEGISRSTFQPSAGELVLFNTRNFHYVEPTQGERVTATSAIGLLPSGDLILWS